MDGKIQSDFGKRRVIAWIIILTVATVIAILIVNLQNGNIVSGLTDIGKSLYSQNNNGEVNSNTPYFAPHNFSKTEISTPSAKPTPTPTTTYYYSGTVKTYPSATPFPTYALPTIAPGAPGSPEWEAQFQKEWNQMNQQNAAMQSTVENAQKEFCQQHADLCNK